MSQYLKAKLFGFLGSGCLHRVELATEKKVLEGWAAGVVRGVCFGNHPFARVVRGVCFGEPPFFKGGKGCAFWETPFCKGDCTHEVGFSYPVGSS